MAGEIQILGLYDLSGDVLEVEASVTVTLRARGWISATTNHYDVTAYGPDGHLLPDAKPRAMSPDELVAYAQRLIREQHVGLIGTSNRVPLAVGS